jgi:hypothetical protein
MTVKTTRPRLDLKVAKWSTVFQQVLEEMVKASGQPDQGLMKIEYVSMAAGVAASLVAGSDLE